MKPYATIAVIILITILGFAVYGNSITGGFIWDDYYVVKDNVYIKNLSYLPDIFSKNTYAGANIAYFSYRPLVLTTYMINYAICGLDVRAYHLTNILLHVMAALTVYWLLIILYKDMLLAFLSSALFVIHPIHVEAVTYIAGRADPLSLLFMMTCFILYIKRSQSKGVFTYTLMCLSYSLALLSKENSLILPALLLLYHYTFRKKIEFKDFFSILGLIIAYILLRLAFVEATLPHTSHLTTLAERIPGFFVSLTNYTKLMLLPVSHHTEYGFKLFKITDPKAVLGILILFSLLTYAFKKRKSDNVIFFSILWFFIALLPSSNLYPIPTGYMADHWIYLSSVGVFLLLGDGILSLFRNKNLKIFAVVLAVAAMIFYGYSTVKYNELWKNPILFYASTLKYSPNSERTNASLAMLYSEVGRKKDAIVLYKKAIEINPYYRDPYINLGNLYMEMRDGAKAIELYKKAIEIMPDFAEAHYILAQIYYKYGEYGLAIQYCDKARGLGYKINPVFLELIEQHRK